MAFYPNFVSEGESWTITLESGESTTAGAIFVRGNFFGVANKTSSTVGDTVIIQRCGVHEIDKTTGTAWTVGTPIFWKASTAKGITTDESGLCIGIAVEAAASGDTTGMVALIQNARPAQSFSTATIAAGTVTVADARITATSHINAIWLTNTTKSGPFKVTLNPGVGYTITVVKVADASDETGAAGTISVQVIY